MFSYHVFLLRFIPLILSMINASISGIVLLTLRLLPDLNDENRWSEDFPFLKAYGGSLNPLVNSENIICQPPP